MSKSNIEWTDEVWNPVTGCFKISQGCKNCYAEVMHKRLKGMGQAKYQQPFTEVICHESELATPHKWKKPKKVFVNSMSDLFHMDVPEEFIQKVFEVMRKTPQHTYQVLTKRSNRLLKLNSEIDWPDNVWMGVSVENSAVQYRITNLVQVDAKVKFVSIEPLLRMVKTPFTGLDWVIVGGESGHNTRPIKKIWVEVIQKQCKVQNIPFFFKQWGHPKNNPNPNDPTIQKDHPQHAKGGCQLNGVVYRETPEMS